MKFSASVLIAASAFVQAAPSSVIARNNDGATITPIRIIQDNSSYAVLEFNPFVKPNTLKVAARYNTSEGNLKPWLSRHPINSRCNDHAVPNAPGYLTSYSLDAKTGEMKYIDSVDTGGYPVPDYGVAAAHCAFFPDGKTAGVANCEFQLIGWQLTGADFGQSASTFSFDPQTGKFGSQTNKGVLDFPGYTPVDGQIGVAGNDNTSQAVNIRPYKVDQKTGELAQIQDDAAEVHVSNDGRFLYASNRNLTAATLIQPGDASDTLAVWSIGTNGTITRIQSAMAYGARQIRAMELSPAGMTATAGGQDYIVAGGLKTDNTFIFKRDRMNGTLELVAQTEGTYMPATYLWLG
ncbi:uncharacterized protein IL334_002998 [Kwoniella shivajii]|uniref:SMP-30/Gluconolactonase/LRE-like region domain-containing protein n=1 Tax=Kwoniella shivajii TaxID=564305 RepID=A0ABZ1CWN7_9TREE|nr:hypothetical protein IL334_002998 [Kwoniella shivajii]